MTQSKRTGSSSEDSVCVRRLDAFLRLMDRASEGMMRLLGPLLVLLVIGLISVGGDVLCVFVVHACRYVADTVRHGRAGAGVHPHERCSSNSRTPFHAVDGIACDRIGVCAAAYIVALFQSRDDAAGFTTSGTVTVCRRVRTASQRTSP